MNENYNEIINNSLDLFIGDLIITVLLNDNGFTKCKSFSSHNHFHASYEIYAVNKGSFISTTNEKSLKLSQNDILLIPPKISHKTSCYSPDLFCTTLSFYIHKNNTAKNKLTQNNQFSEFKLYSSKLSSIEKSTLFHNKNCLTILKKLKKIKKIDCFNIHIVNSYLKVFFLELFSKIKTNKKNNKTIQIKTSYFYDLKRTSIEKYIAFNYMDSITLNDFANFLCVSKSQVNRILTNIFNMSFKQLITKQRMEQALIFLTENEEPITKIAELCGYNSYNSFFISFKKYYEKNPETVRDENNLKQ